MSEIIKKARQFAIDAHGGQMYGDYPYSYHLESVYNNVLHYAPKTRVLMTPMPSSAALAAAWLHDTLEDTEVTFKEMFDEFGRHITRLVFAVTNEPGENRKERHERTYPKLMAAGREAIAIKLADRISNVEHSLSYNHGMFKMYKKEYKHFRRALHLPGELKEMWAKLDVLMATEIED